MIRRHPGFPLAIYFSFAFAAGFSVFDSFFSDFSAVPLFSLFSELAVFSAFGSGELFPP